MTNRLFNNTKLVIVLFFALIFFFIMLFYYEEIHPNWDLRLHISNTYRMFSGQVPHSDFFVPFAHIIYFFSSIGLKLFPNTLLGINFGLLSLSIILSILSFKILINSSSNLIYNYILISVVVLSFLVPRFVSYEYLWAYTGIYNRYGYGILGALIFSSIPIIFNNVYKTDLLIYQGVLVGILLYIKITFFLISIFFIFFFFNFNKKILLLYISIFLTILLFGFLIDWRYINFFTDFLYLNNIVSDNNSLLKTIYKRSFNINYLILWSFFFMMIILSKKNIVNKSKIILLGFYCYFSDIFFNYSSYQPYENTMIVFYAGCLLILNYTANIKYLSLFNFSFLTFENIKKLFLFIIIFFLIIKYLFLHTYNLIDYFPQTFQKILKLNINKNSYNSQIYEKIPIEIKKEIFSKKILLIGETDDISFALNLPVSKNYLSFWQYGFNFNENSMNIHNYLKPNVVFDDVDVLILPKYNETFLKTSIIFYNMYNLQISNNFNNLYNDNNFEFFIKKEDHF
jgi:hypothetical protein